MTFLAPLGWLALLSVPALLYIWRLAATKRVTSLSSLIPFERLLARPPRKRSQLATNLLFWLQLLALIAAAAILAQPVLWQPSTRTVLVLLDTSASMQARAPQGGLVWDRAMQWLGKRLTGQPLAERWFIVTTTPVSALTAQPTGDPIALRAALASAQIAAQSGSLSTALRVGQALLGAGPQQILVVSDEPQPAILPARVTWHRVSSVPENVGLVGLDAQGSLCLQDDARILATVQNFGPQPAVVQVTARQQGRTLAEGRAELPQGQRQAIALTVPPQTQGAVDLAVTPEDALKVDNHATVQVRQAAAWPIVIASADQAFVSAIEGWLAACPTLSSSTQRPAEGHPFLLITDQPAGVGAAPAVLLFERPAKPVPMRSHWLVATDHPVGAYVAALGVVSAALQRQEAEVAGTPVVWAVVEGRRLPVVVAQETESRRTVSFFCEPTSDRTATALILTFFNGLRWALGAGAVKGSLDAENFLNPVESNIAAPASTWQPIADTASTESPTRLPMPMSGWVLWVLAALLVLEWLAYCWRQRPRTS